ncbi:MAG: hypothetical protein H6577_05425 [Lewinellaceae bacterium]|nr:hypothetical protein [Saprospiraceae bacterium]MCB9337545.1 hypothetical protein [Lewinellaceae bacterium]
MMQTSLKSPLSNVQIELLELFADNYSDDELVELKQMLVAWRFKKLKEAANKAWDEKGYTAEDMERLLKADLRKPYKSQDEYLAKRKTAHI